MGRNPKQLCLTRLTTSDSSVSLDGKKWIKFLSITISFFKHLLLLGKYLSPLIDIGPTMSTMILTPMGLGVHCSTNRPLMPKELTNPIKQDCMKAFLITAEDWWGKCLARGQLEQVGLIYTLDPQPFMDKEQMDKTFPTLQEEVTQEAGD